VKGVAYCERCGQVLSYLKQLKGKLFCSECEIKEKNADIKKESEGLG